jgi:hypothetical protein
MQYRQGGVHERHYNDDGTYADNHTDVQDSDFWIFEERKVLDTFDMYLSMGYKLIDLRFQNIYDENRCVILINIIPTFELEVSY